MALAHARASGGGNPPFSNGYFICDMSAIDAEDRSRFRTAEINDKSRDNGNDLRLRVFTKFTLADGTVNDDPHKVNQEDWILTYVNGDTTAIGSGRAGSDGNATAPGAGRAVAIAEIIRGDDIKYKQYMDLPAVAKLEADGRRAAAKERTPDIRDEDLARRYPENRILFTRNVALTSKGVPGMTFDGIRHQIADLAKHQFIYGVGGSKKARDAETVKDLRNVEVGMRNKSIGAYIPTKDDINMVARDYYKTFVNLTAEAMKGPVRVMSADGKNVIADIPRLSDLGFKAGGLEDGTIAIVAPGDAKSNPDVTKAMIELNKGFNARFSQEINGTYSLQNAEKTGADADAYARIRAIGNAIDLNAYAARPMDNNGKTADFTMINPVNAIAITPYVNAAERGFAAARHQEIAIGGVHYNSKNGDSAELTTEVLFGKAVTEAAAEIDSYGPAQHILPQLDPKLTGADRAAAIIERQGTVDDIRASRMRELSDIANGRASFPYDLSNAHDRLHGDDNLPGNNYSNGAPAAPAKTAKLSKAQIEARRLEAMAVMTTDGCKYTIAVDSTDERDTLYDSSFKDCDKTHLLGTISKMMLENPDVDDLFANGPISNEDRVKANQGLEAAIGEAMGEGRQFIVTECVDDPRSVLIMAVRADQIRIESGDKNNDWHRTVCTDVENVKAYGYDWPMKLTLSTDGEPKWELQKATAKEIADCAASTGFEKVDIRLYGHGPDKMKAQAVAKPEPASPEPTSLFRQLAASASARTEEKDDEPDYGLGI